MTFLLFEFIQIVYWLALSTWFGGVLFIALCAPIILRTVQEHDPTLPTVLSVNLEGQHATLLGGTIISNLISMLLRMEGICAVVLAITIAVQWGMHSQEWPEALVRTLMFVAAVLVVAYDWRIVWPRMRRHRQEYIDHADEPEIANPAREQFNRFQKESMLLLMIVVALLLGMIVFSTSIFHNAILITTR